MRNRICVSVIMPIYNCAQFLNDSIGSILQQDFEDYELLLIDDGSTDDSWEICKKYMQKDDRVRAFHTENRGVSGARNLGIELAEGEYVYFVDADDTLFPNALTSLIEPMREDMSVDIVVAYYDGTDTDVNKGDMPKGKYVIGDVLEHILKNAPTFYYGVCWNKLYRLSIIRREHLKFPQGIIWSEDMLFNMDYLKYCNDIYYTDKIVYFYNRNPGIVNKLWSKQFSFEQLSDKLHLEKMRINALMELLQHHDKVNELSGWLYDFALNRYNQCFADVFKMKNISSKVRRSIMIELINMSEIRELLSGYSPQRRYWVENIYVWMILKQHYYLIYYFSMLKFYLQDNQFWQKFSARYKFIWPKFSL